jgi:hypothetical protein
MTWNHRIVRFKQAEGFDDYLAICECYYDDNGKLEGHTMDAVTVGSETVEGLRWTLENMLACLDKEIVEEMK